MAAKKEPTYTVILTDTEWSGDAPQVQLQIIGFRGVKHSQLNQKSLKELVKKHCKFTELDGELLDFNYVSEDESLFVQL